MPALLVQSIAANGGAYVQTAQLTFASNVTPGNLIVVAVCKGLAGSFATFSDSLGHTWTKHEGEIGTDMDFAFYSTVVVTAGAMTITYGDGTNFQDHVGIAKEYTGLTASPFDQDVSSVETGFAQSHPSGNTGALAQANSLVIAAISTENNSSYTAPTGYGNTTTLNGFDAFKSIAMADKNVVVTDAVSGDWTTTGFDRATVYVAVFKAVPPLRRGSMGMG